VRECTFCNLITDKDNPTWIADMKYSVALLNLEQTYRGRCLVVLKQHYDNLLDVPKELFDQLNMEMLRLASAIKQAWSPDRLNFAILGNEVSHVHWHVIPRYEADPNWGRPPWPIPKRTYLSQSEYRELAGMLRTILPGTSEIA